MTYQTYKPFYACVAFGLVAHWRVISQGVPTEDIAPKKTKEPQSGEVKDRVLSADLFEKLSTPALSIWLALVDHFSPSRTGWLWRLCRAWRTLRWTWSLEVSLGRRVSRTWFSLIFRVPMGESPSGEYNLFIFVQFRKQVLPRTWRLMELQPLWTWRHVERRPLCAWKLHGQLQPLWAWKLAVQPW